MTLRATFTAIALAIVTGACGATALSPAALDSKHDACSTCRMTVSDPKLAAQIVAPGEEPRFFDDLGCLRKYLDEYQQPDAVIYVADHRTGEWTPASTAVYARLARASTPMASGLIAHATLASRSQDAAAGSSTPVEPDIVLGKAVPAARRRP